MHFSFWFGLLLLHLFRHYIGPKLFYFLFYVKFKEPLSKVKVQQAVYPKEKQIQLEKHNIFKSQFSEFLIVLICLGLFKFGIIQLKFNGEGTSFLESAFVFFLLIFLQDTYFYFTHRMMHTKWFYRHIHLVHHRSVLTNPYTSFSMHPMEKIIELLFFPFVLCLIPMTPNVLLLYIFMSSLINFIGHSGFEFNDLSKVPPNPLATTPTFHERHHMTPNSNYALYLKFWDVLLDTRYRT